MGQLASEMNMWINLRGAFSGMLSTAALTLDAISALLIMSCFLGQYVRITRKVVLGFGSFLGLVVIFNAIGIFVRTFAAYPEAERYLTINFAYPFLGYCFLVYLFLFPKKRLYRALEATIVLIIYEMYLEGIVRNILILFYGNPIIVDREILNAFSLISLFYGCGNFLLGLVTLLVFYVGFYRKGLFLRLKPMEMLLLILWLILTWIYGGLATGVYAPEVTKYSLLLLFPLMSLVLPVFLLMNRYRNLLRDKNAYQQTYLEAELSYVEQYKKNQVQTRAFRHDVINQLSLMSMLMKEGKAREAEAHLDQLLGEVKELSPKFITGDEMLDCIVAMKVARMEELGIAFSSDGVVDGGLNMKPMDVCGIFANVLDNAIDAACKAKDGKIELRIKRTEKFFVIRVSNSMQGKADVDKMFEGQGYTSKKDAEHHGFGLHNVRSAVEKYDGLLKAEAEEGWFNLSVLIPRRRSH